MKTITYNEMLYRAAEAAGRTRDNLPVEEAAVLKSIFASELPDVWASEDWDDLRQPLLAVTLDSTRSFRNPYGTVELGEVLAVLAVPATGYSPWQRLEFYRTGDTYTVLPWLKDTEAGGQVPVGSTVLVYWQSPCPDLLGLDAAALAALTIPSVFGNYLALRGAGHLLAADGQAGLAGVQYRLAEEQLEFSRTLIQRPKAAIWLGNVGSGSGGSVGTAGGVYAGNYGGSAPTFTPIAAAVAFDTSTGGFWTFDGSAWTQLIN